MVIVLTILTQVGGLVLILCIPFFRVIKGRRRGVVRPLVFIGFYLLSTFVIIPPIAKTMGRVPMPVFSNEHVKPLNILTCVLNRHYVRFELLRTVETVAERMKGKHPQIVIAYLDANFPFVDGFPLLPHLSHNDGRKLDLAFFYSDSKTKEPLVNDAPSFIGYGVYEELMEGEIDQPQDCANKGYWQYSFLESLVPQWNRDRMTFDPVLTKELITLLVQENAIGKLFIEPHLKHRMNLNHPKVRFHGCQAVRHDDHIHIQL